MMPNIVSAALKAKAWTFEAEVTGPEDEGSLVRGLGH